MEYHVTYRMNVTDYKTGYFCFKLKPKIPADTSA